VTEVFSTLWREFRTHVSHWFIGGAVGAAIGISPDRWFEELFHAAEVPADAIHLWSLEIHPRWLLIGLGGVVMVADILGHKAQHSTNAGPTLTHPLISIGHKRIGWP
jgi:hypothetical protein